MQLYKVIANTSAILASTAIALEANKMGVSKAIENSKNEGAKDTTRDLIGASKLNYPSPLYNEVKKGIFKFKNPNPVSDVYHGVCGYFKGFGNGLVHNIPTIGFAALTLCARGKGKASNAFRTIGVIGLGASVIWNFIKNGTNLFEKKDYLG